MLGDAGTMVAPNVVAAYHQHLFCARLDMALDDSEGGKKLVVSEVSIYHSYSPSYLCFPKLSIAHRNCGDPIKVLMVYKEDCSIAATQGIMHVYLPPIHGIDCLAMVHQTLIPGIRATPIQLQA